MKLAAQIVSDPGELASLAPEWLRLWERCPQATLFQAPDWLLAWWGAFSPGELMSVAVFGQERLLGFAPLYLDVGEFGSRLLPLGISLSDYLDILIEPGLEQPVGRAMLLALAQDARWSVIEWNELHPCAVALRLEANGCCAIAEGTASPCTVLPLETEASPVRHSKQRHLRLAHNRAQRVGRLNFVDATESSTAFILFDELVRLHRARWRSRNQDGVLSDPRVIDFHRRVLPMLVPRGWAKLCALEVAGEVAAVSYVLKHRRHVYCYLTGFDPAHAFVSPGSLLLSHIIEQSRRAGMDEVDFLRGAEPYKLEWGPQLRQNRRRELHRIDARRHA